MAIRFSSGTPDWMLCSGANTKPPPGARTSDPPPNLFAKFVRGPLRENGLRRGPPAPEGELAAKASLQRLRIHARRRRLQWIECVDPQFDEVRDQLGHAAARVEEQEDLAAGCGTNGVEQTPVQRLDRTAPA